MCLHLGLAQRSAALSSLYAHDAERVAKSVTFSAAAEARHEAHVRPPQMIDMDPFSQRRLAANRYISTSERAANGHLSSSSGGSNNSNSSSPVSFLQQQSTTTTAATTSSSASRTTASNNRRHDLPSFSASVHGAMQEPLRKTSALEMNASLRDLKHGMSELQNLNRASSVSLGMPLSTGSQPALLRRGETSPAIVELPPLQSSPDSLEENGNAGSGPFPLVTSPASEDIASEMHFSDQEATGSLTSPNLVSSSGLPLTHGMSLPNRLFAAAVQANGVGGVPASASVYSHEARKVSSSLKTKIVTDKASTSSEKATANTSQMMRLHTNDLSFEQKSAASATKERLETSLGHVSEKTSGMKAMAKRFETGDLVHQESSLDTLSHSNVQNSGFALESMSQSSSQTSMSASTSGCGTVTHQSHHQSSSSKKMSIMRTSSLFGNRQINDLINTKMTMEELEKGLMKFDDLDCLTSTSNTKSVENTLVKYCSILSSSVEQMKLDGNNVDSLIDKLGKLNDLMTKAWTVPAHGHEMGSTLCDQMRDNGGLDLLINNCAAEHERLQFNSAKLLQQCLITENRGYVVEKGLEKVVKVAKNYTSDISDVEKSRVGTGILEHLFKHSESTCSDVISMGGLDTVVNECKSTDVETLRHCAGALANVAMYGGAENQEAMMKLKVPLWLFPLAFNNDDTIKYYACLAIAALVANKEIEAEVQKSGALELIEPFVQTHTPRAFAHTSATHSHGQSPHWLKRLIPVLMSHREEARNLAAFHFCMEAEIKKQQEKTDFFREIGAIESLKKVASSPNGIASRYAAQTLRLIGEEVPHKLSQQVPTWSVEDVKEWVKQIGFPVFADSFVESRVDGDLLLQLTEEMLREDVAMRNGILRRRFLRELTNLKRRADYSSCDPTNLNHFLQTLGPEYCVYTYDLINAGIDRDTLMDINDEHLLAECGISNKIHRLKILQGVKVERGEISITDEGNKNLDVFISYRRSNGSQLASLLKVHLEIRNLKVFLDVDRLEAGKFDNNLLQSIRSARNLVLVLTPGALDRCFEDQEQRDWIHKEVACALQSHCNIIPVFDNFIMPDPTLLPESMRAVTAYNGVKWIHDYQEACVDKIDRFIRGDSFVMDRFLRDGTASYCSGSGSTSGVVALNRQNTYNSTGSDDTRELQSQ